VPVKSPYRTKQNIQRVVSDHGGYYRQGTQHVCELRGTCVGKPKGKRPFAKPRIRWEKRFLLSL